MALTVANNITNLDSYIGDTSNDRVTAAERLQFITEATTWLQEELGNDTLNATYDLDFFDSVNYYKVTTAVADLLTGSDLRREEEKQVKTFAHKSSMEIAEEIGQGATESSWTIERRDTNTFLYINHASNKPTTKMASFDSLTSGGGTWEVDATNGDATNLTVDVIEKKEGSASLNFDMDRSQSGNDVMEIGNTTLNTTDLTQYEDLGSWFFWAYVPDVSATIFSSFDSFTLYWGSDTSNYWSATVTTDVDGSAWADGWNRVKVDWKNATKTSSPDITAITYMQVDYNYTTPTGDDTDFRIDDLIIANPERLKFHYISWNVGTNTSGTDVTVFGATTDIPWYSGVYDQYKFAVAHKAASLVYKSLRLFDEAGLEEREAEDSLRRAKSIIPISKNPEVKSFKVMGIRFPRR